MRVRVFFKTKTGVAYIEDEPIENPLGLIEYSGFLHLKSLDIKLKDVIDKEVIYEEQD